MKCNKLFRLLRKCGMDAQLSLAMMGRRRLIAYVPLPAEPSRCLSMSKIQFLKANHNPILIVMIVTTQTIQIIFFIFTANFFLIII